MNWVVVFSLALLSAVYLPVALWLRDTYVPPHPGLASVSDVKLIMKLERPFLPSGGHAFWARVPGLEAIADSMAQPERSPAMLYENDTLLGPAHIGHADISRMGGGLYSHWGAGIVFSSKNGEQPGPKGKTYWLVVPKDIPVAVIPHESPVEPLDSPAQQSVLEPWASDRQPWPSGRQP